MNRQVLKKDSQLLYWLVAALLTMSVSLADAALIAVVASLITVAQLMNGYQATFMNLDSGRPQYLSSNNSPSRVTHRF